MAELNWSRSRFRKMDEPTLVSVLVLELNFCPNFGFDTRVIHVQWIERKYIQGSDQEFVEFAGGTAGEHTDKLGQCLVECYHTLALQKKIHQHRAH